MIISIDNLNAGINWWRSRSKSKFPLDFHNADYDKIYKARDRIYEDRAEGDKDPWDLWWEATVDRLGQWKAYRGPIPPNKKSEISKAGTERLPKIAAQYAKLAASPDTEPCIETMCWQDIGNLYALVSEIKPKSPVFASKTCHFLFPKLFIVMDNTATTVSDYELYWRGMQDEWYRLEDKEKAEARNLLTNTIISSGKPLHPKYPLVTKILELCHIGHKPR
jgi:hypothetical protein